MDPALGLPLLVDLTASLAGSGAGPEEGQASLRNTLTSLTLEERGLERQDGTGQRGGLSPCGLGMFTRLLWEWYSSCRISSTMELVK